MNKMKLNVRQSIFVVFFVLVFVPSCGYFITLYSHSTLFIPIIAVVSAFVGSLFAKKIIKG